MRTSPRLLPLTLATLLTASFLPSAFAADPYWSVVAQSGQTWQNQSNPFDSVNFATLDPLGNVYFTAYSNGGDQGNYARYSYQQLTLVSPAPSPNFDAFASGNGIAILADTNTEIRTWSFAGNTTTTIATTSAPPGNSSLTLSPVISSTGFYAYWTNYSDGINPDSVRLYKGSNGGSSLLLDSADPGTNIVTGQPVLNIQDVRINSSGTTVALATNGGSFQAIWKDDTKIIRTQQTVGALTLDQIYTPTLNNAGTIVFKATTSDINSEKIFTYSSGPDPVIAVDSGINYANVGSISHFENPLINRTGKIIFSAISDFGGSATLADDASIVITSPTGPATIVAREGDAVSGFPTFSIATDEVVNSTPFFQISINAAGQSVFFANLVDSGNPSETFKGLFHYVPGSLSPTLVAYVGETLPALDNLGDLAGRTIADITLYGLSGGDDGYTASLNDNGQFTFQLFFDAFSTAIITIPEPATLSLLTLAALPLLRRPKKSRKH